MKTIHASTEQEYREELLNFCHMACISELAYFQTRNLLYHLGMFIFFSLIKI